MRLSEAIPLGSMMIKPVPGRIFDDGGNSGCAMGMALAAVGKFKDFVAGNVFGEWWPWEWTNQENYTLLPCNCTGPDIMAGGCVYEPIDRVTQQPGRVLVHLFNYHVAMKKDWTIEQLADWVRSVEPAESEVTKTEIVKEEVHATA